MVSKNKTLKIQKQPLQNRNEIKAPGEYFGRYFSQ